MAEANDTRRCSVEGCGTNTHSAGMCKLHYSRWRRTGSAERLCVECEGDMTGRPSQSKYCLPCNTCPVLDCDSVRFSDGLCRHHYKRKAAGLPLTTGCDTCGKEMAIRGQGRYCSEECNVCEVDGCHRVPQGGKMCRLHHRRWEEFGNPIRPCMSCGKDITGSPGKVLYCSSSCKVCTVENCSAPELAKGLCSNHYKRRADGRPDWNVCGVCDAVIYGGGPGALYCSAECRQCTVEGCQSPRDTNGYCSKHHLRLKHWGAFHAYCRVCGQEIPDDGSGYYNFCSDLCRPDRIRREHRKYRRKVVGGKVPPICGICDDPIDLELEWPHLMSLTVDHIVPISWGGGNEDSNLRPAHFSCNSRRGDKVNVPDQAALNM